MLQSAYRETTPLSTGTSRGLLDLIGSSSEQLIAAPEQAYGIGLAHTTATTPAMYGSEPDWARSLAILGLDQGASSPHRCLGCELSCPPIVPLACLHECFGLYRRVHP